MSERAFWVVLGLAGAGVAGYWGMWRVCGSKGRRRLDGVVTWGMWLLVGLASLALVARHEPWRDELHTWLVTRDLSLGELWHEMRWEGHVMLWQLVLHPFARWGAPVWTLGAVSWAINWATLAFFAKKAPFGAVEKAVAMASVAFAYLNPVVSRCYVLVPPLLFGLAALWGERDRRPLLFGGLVALLANTHLYLEGTAGLIALVFAWENVLRRKDGKGWRSCGPQWAGLAVMAAGILAAVAQVAPTLWEPSRGWGWHCGWRADLLAFLGLSRTWGWKLTSLAGAGWVGWACWKRDKGVFWVYAGSLAYMVGFSVFLYSAMVMNRAVLWWPLMLFAGWCVWGGWRKGGVSPIREGAGRPLGEGVGGAGMLLGIRVAVVLAGLALFRPDLMAADWRWEYDPLPGACRYVAETYGADAEVWIHGDEMSLEVARAYLGNTWDWRSGEKAERMCMALASWKGDRPFAGAVREVFAKHPEKESLLVMGFPGGGSGLEWSDTEGAEVRVEYVGAASVFGTTGEVVVMRVDRGDGGRWRLDGKGGGE